LLKGLQLSELFYQEVVQPLLATHFPQLAYSAALLGPGSEVLGFDDAQSTDHDWGPRLQLYLNEADYRTHHQEIDQLLRHGLPDAIHGYPTNMAFVGDQALDNPRPAGVPIEHSVRIVALPEFFRAILRFDPTGPIQATDWLGVSEQALLTLVRGRVFYDGLGQLAPIRAKLHYYPETDRPGGSVYGSLWTGWR
jgi:hypothetical protein